MTPDHAEEARKRKAKYRRARIRNFVFTVGPDRLSGGRLARRHLASTLHIRHVEAQSPRWPAAFDGLRIGHVSDFHIGELIPLARGLEAVKHLAEQEVDLVVCTGDVVDLRAEAAGELLASLGALRAPLGVVLVLGNHDELHCAGTVARLARDAGITVLHDDAVAFRRGSAQLVVGGTSWASSAAACAERVDRAGGSSIDLLLSHNPKSFARAAQHRIPLTLSGHTHGGQIAIPRRPNASLAVTHRHRAGLFERGPSRLFVTTGVGSWFPLRVNCPAEIAIVAMRRGDGHALRDGR